MKSDIKLIAFQLRIQRILGAASAEAALILCPNCCFDKLHPFSKRLFVDSIEARIVSSCQEKLQISGDAAEEVQRIILGQGQATKGSRN